MTKLLLKHDLKKSSKVLIILYIITIGLAVITRIINIFSYLMVFNVLGSVFAGLTYSAIANVLINTFTNILNYVIKSFFKDESYLTHTLPVKKSSLLNAKYLCALILVFSSFIVSLGAFLIIHASAPFFDTLNAFITATISNFSISVASFIIVIALLLLSQICALMTFAFASIIKGYSYNNKRALMGLVWFLCFYFSAIICMLIVLIIFCLITGSINELFSSVPSQTTLLNICIVAIVCYVIFSFLTYLFSLKIFNKGVNVD